MRKSLILVHDFDVEGNIILDILKKNQEALGKNSIDYMPYPGTIGTEWKQLPEDIQQRLQNYEEVIGLKMHGNPSASNCQSIGTYYHDVSRRHKGSSKNCLEQLHDFLVKKLGENEKLSLAEDLIGSESTSPELIEGAKKSIDTAYKHDPRLICINFPGSSQQLGILNGLMGQNYQHCENLLINCYQDNSVVFYGEEENVRNLFNKFSGGKIEDSQTKCVYDFPDNEYFINGAQTILDYVEHQVIGYNRLVTQRDIHQTVNLGGIQIHQISGEAFHKAAAGARSTNPYGTYFVLRKPEEYDLMNCLVANSGAGGLAVKGNEITSLFKNPSIAEKDSLGAATSSTLMVMALKNGGKVLDCYDGFLPDYYMKFGFVPVGYKEFNDTWAPNGWNYERDGRPNLIFMLHSGIPLMQTFWENETGKLPKFKDYEGRIPKFEDYDSAVEARNTILSDENKMKEIRDIREEIKQEKLRITQGNAKKRASAERAI